MGILIGFILTDIALTYNTTVGTAGQIITAASIAGMIITPFLAALSIKYRPRTLLLIGISLITVSAFGCSIAFNYLSMLVFFSLSGLGTAMVTPMIMTIIGEKIPEEKQSGIIGVIMASTPMLSTIAGLTIAYIVSGGWQTAYRVYVFPIILMCLILAFFFLPRTSVSESSQQAKTGVREGFKQIVGFRSALACLAGTIFFTTAWGGLLWYIVSFYKETFNVSTTTAGIIWSANTFLYVVGSLLCGRIVPRFGNKRMTYISSVVIGLCTVLFTHIPNYYLAVGIGLIVPFFGAFWSASSNALVLGQVPEYSGAMMSLNSGSTQFGRALGSLVGGLAINLGGYGLMGYFFGFVGLLSFLIIRYFATDPITESKLTIQRR
jgi:predicted MFS family arabinose efflux permease